MSKRFSQQAVAKGPKKNKCIRVSLDSFTEHILVWWEPYSEESFGYYNTYSASQKKKIHGLIHKKTLAFLGQEASQIMSTWGSKAAWS